MIPDIHVGMKKIKVGMVVGPSGIPAGRIAHLVRVALEVGGADVVEVKPNQRVYIQGETEQRFAVTQLTLIHLRMVQHEFKNLRDMSREDRWELKRRRIRARHIHSSGRSFPWLNL